MKKKANKSVSKRSTSKKRTSTLAQQRLENENIESMQEKPTDKTDAVDDDIKIIRNRLINRALIVFSILLVPAFLASLLRIKDIGWQPIMNLQIIIVVLLVLVTILRQRISTKFLTIALLGILFLLSISGLLTFGLSGGGLLSLMTMCLLTTLFFTYKAGILVLIISILTLMFLNIGIQSGTITFNIDFNEYAVSITSWIVGSLALIVLTGFLFAIMELFNRTLNNTITKLKKEVDQRIQAEKEIQAHSSGLALLNTITIAANVGQNIDELMQICLDEICKFTGWPVGHAYIMAADGSDKLIPIKIWHLDNPDKFYNFRQVTEKTNFDRGIGLPGRVLASGEPAWIVDVTKDSNFPRAKVCDQLGIKAGFAFPVYVEKQVFSVFEFFDVNAVEPSKQILDIMSQIGRQVGEIIQRKQAKEEIQKSRDELEVRVKERTKELQSSEERFDFAMRGSNDGLWDWDYKTGKAFYSERWMNMLGYQTGELMGTLENWSMLCHPDDMPRTLKVIDACAKGVQDDFSIEFRMRHKDGYWVPILSRAYVVRDSSTHEVLRLVGTHSDLTERKEAEEKLRNAKQDAETATEAKANFLAAMSHEIRAPMNGVIGMVDLLRQTELNNEQKQMLQTVGDSGQSLLTIINDILDFSKIEAGKLDLESIPLSLTDVVECSAQTIAANATKKGLRLITYVDPELPQFVTGDPVRIRQIIINLGGNAIKFTEEGAVVIRAERVGDGEEDKVTIRFSVVDQGIGISEEGQGKLFQAFSQVESSTTRQYGGTGLGLTICKLLTEIMGGEIGVKSQLGEGSEFYAILPFSRSDKRVQEDKVRSLDGLRILLIGSHPAEEAILRRYLEYWHAEVTTSDELSTCLEQCMAAKGENKPYDIVVSGPQWAREEQFEMREKVTTQSTLSGTRFICLLRGKRRQERLDLPDSVCLDVDPLRRAAFLSAVAVAVGRASPEVHYEEEVEDLKATVKAPTVDEALAQGTLILVAEDNPTNRDVIGRQLTLLGYAFEMAEDGKLALETWRNKYYGILLTDCHMPNMDGFELTDAIRKDEKDTETRAPIIAITANALQGEAERCLAAGMDDYLSKPIDMKDLRQTLRKWMPQVKTETIRREGPEEDISTVEKTIAVNEETGNSPIDERALKDMFGDDPEMFKEILNDFLTPSQVIIGEIQAGWKERSAEAINQASHKLKSSARSIGATELADVCQSLETAGREEDWDMIDERVSNLDHLMEDVESYINNLQK